MSPRPHLVSAAVAALCFVSVLNSIQKVAGDDNGPARLSLAGKMTRDDLRSVTSVAFSPDGKFLYASAWNAATHVVAAVDDKTGELSHVQTITDEERLAGATALRLSRDGRLAVAGAFRSGTISLYTRDAKTGKLTYRDHAKQGAKEIECLPFCIDAFFSIDGRFLYGVDDEAGLSAFRVLGMKDDPRLEFVESNADDSLKGMRGLVLHPNGKHLFAACRDAGTLVVLRRDVMSGKTTVVQALRNGTDGARGLAGAFGVSVSPDGKFVYSVSGRFGGDDDVAAYSFDEKAEKLTQIQVVTEIAAKGEDTREPVAVEGLNEIAVSPDGESVYTVATVSGSLIAFDRNAESGRLEIVSLFGDSDALGGAAGIAVSPDGRFVAVAAEEKGTVSVYRRVK